MAVSLKELGAQELDRRCDPSTFHFETTADLGPLEGMVGQLRAVDSLQFGLGIKTRGFNLYASGVTGTGRNHAVRELARKIAQAEPAPSDWVYVHNFDDPFTPNAISLPAGMGCELANEMREVVETARREIPRAFESEDYQRRRQQLTEDFQQQRQSLFREVEEQAEREGMMLHMTPMGIMTVPRVDGRPMAPEEYAQLPPEQREELDRKGERLRGVIQETMPSLRRLEKSARERVSDLDREVALYAVGHQLDDARECFRDFPKVIHYLGKAQEDILSNLDLVRAAQAGEEGRAMNPAEAMQRAAREEETFSRYTVNVFVDNCRATAAPVVVEENPTYYNLFGKVEYRQRFGVMVTDASLTKAGSIHRANGGYLILPILGVLLNFRSWDTLKIALHSREVRIENIAEHLTPAPAATLRPEPIPLNVKVILVGPPQLYYLLYALDEDFQKLFKVRADFDVIMDKTPDHVQEYAAFIASYCQEQGLRHFTPEAVARVVDYGTRLAEDQKKLSTRLATIGDLLAEAGYWASAHRQTYVQAEHVLQALERKEVRSRLVQDHLLEMIREGQILFDHTGETIGQVNGLALMSVGDHVFGRPSRITARTGIGRQGLINIEREAALSGNIHNKAVMIISGYLAGKYAHDKPLAVSATLAFEQSYGMIGKSVV